MTSSSSSFASVDSLDSFVATLEYQIQEAIARTVDPAPNVRCRFHQGRLLVLSEASEAAETSTERDKRFRQLAFSIGQGLAATELPQSVLTATDDLSVRLYLRQLGTASPYAARSWRWRLTDLSDRSSNVANSGIPTTSPDDAMDTQAGALVLLSPRVKADQPPQEDTPSTAATDAKAPATTATDSPQPAYLKAVRRQWQTLQAASQDWPWKLVAGVAATGLLVGGVTYGITRPCLIGSCDRRQTASDLSRTALTRLQDQPTVADVKLAHDDLIKAVRLLSGIPPWSPRYDTAQAELFRYRTQLADLEWIMSAQANAAAAADKSQEPPHPVPLWVEVHLLWQKAVNDLRRIPDDSPVAAFAQQKLAEYEVNYATIGQRLTTEEQAEANLNDAMQAGQLATSQAKQASALPEWVQAQTQWQKAVAALNQIPQGTLAHDEARSLREDYQVQLVQTRTRVNLEKAGDRAYEASQIFAAAAQQAEQSNQWTVAVDQWRRAHDNIRQVPEGTNYHTNAQSLIDPYQASLQQARERLKQAVALQQVDDDLADLCPLAAGVCTYSYSDRQIELILRSPYDSAIRQSTSPPSIQGHVSQSSSVVEQTHRLIQEIMRLGNQVQIPIVLYDTNRQFIARYKPDRGGFSKQP